MKSFIICCALLAAAMAAPQQETAQILHQESNITPEGYQFSFETSDGTARQEQGTLKQIDADHQAIEVTGSYRYVAPDGQTYSVIFTADENGFKPQEHLESQAQSQGQQPQYQQQFDNQQYQEYQQ